MIVGILMRTPTMHVGILASGALSHLGQGHEPSMKQRPPTTPRLGPSVGAANSRPAPIHGDVSAYWRIVLPRWL